MVWLLVACTSEPEPHDSEFVCTDEALLPHAEQTYDALYGESVDLCGYAVGGCAEQWFNSDAFWGEALGVELLPRLPVVVLDGGHAGALPAVVSLPPKPLVIVHGDMWRIATEAVFAYRQVQAAGLEGDEAYTELRRRLGEATLRIEAEPPSAEAGFSLRKEDGALATKLLWFAVLVESTNSWSAHAQRELCERVEWSEYPSPPFDELLGNDLRGFFASRQFEDGLSAETCIGLRLWVEWLYALEAAELPASADTVDGIPASEYERWFYELPDCAQLF